MHQIPRKALWVDSMGVYPYDPSIVNQCTFKSKQGESYCLAIVEKDKVRVPRNMVSSTNSVRFVDAPVSTPLVCNAPPRNEDQVTCIAASVNLLSKGHCHILKAPTGWGKSYAGVAIACTIGQRTLILVTKTDLIEGWRKNLTTVAGIHPSRIGHVQGDICDWEGKDIVIGMVHSVVIEGKYPPEFFTHFGLLMVDEVHRMGAEHFNKAMTLFPARLRLGLSATPRRGDGKMDAVYAHIGPMLVQGTQIPMSPKILITKTGWRIPTHTSEGKRLFCSAGKMASANKEMGSSILRNNLILQFVKDARAAGRKHVVIMSDLKDGHLGVLYAMMINQKLVDARDIGWYVGSKDKRELDLAASKPVILATYKMCSEGTDYPQWDTLVLANPRSDVEQIIGRVMRESQDKRQPVVLDLVDEGATLAGYAKHRLKQYFSVGATIVRMN